MSEFNSEEVGFDPEKFANWLNDAFKASSFKSFSELADDVKLSRATVSGYATARPQTASNKPSRPKRENVIKLAGALDKDVDEALLIAGHSPVVKKTKTREERARELLESSFGSNGKPRLEDVKQVLDFVEFVVAKRNAEKQ